MVKFVSAKWHMMLHHLRMRATLKQLKFFKYFQRISIEHLQYQHTVDRD